MKNNMNNETRHHIWSSDINDELGTMEEIKEQYQEFLEINNLPADWTEDESKVYDYAYKTVETYLDDEKANIKFFEREHGKKTYLVIADIGRWDGRYAGGQIIEGMIEVIEKASDDSTTIYQMGRKLMIDTANHDGSSHFEIFELTKKGLEWYENHVSYDDRRTICEHLRNTSSYIKYPSLFNELYGWKI